MIESLFGSFLGGLFRLAPEILKLLDRKNERAHEIKMLGLQADLEKQRGTFRLEDRYVEHSTVQLDAIAEAFREQSATARASYRWVAAASALVRPGITYVLFGLYVVVKLVSISYAISDAADWREVLIVNWSADDFALLNLVVTFWFVGRAIERYQH